MAIKRHTNGKNEEIKKAIITLLESDNGKPKKLKEIETYVKKNVKKWYSKEAFKMALINLSLYDFITKIDKTTYEIGDKKYIKTETTNSTDSKGKSKTNNVKTSSKDTKDKMLSKSVIYDEIVKLLESIPKGETKTNTELKGHLIDNVGTLNEKTFNMVLSKLILEEGSRIERVQRGIYKLKENDSTTTNVINSDTENNDTTVDTDIEATNEVELDNNNETTIVGDRDVVGQYNTFENKGVETINTTNINNISDDNIIVSYDSMDKSVSDGIKDIISKEYDKFLKQVYGELNSINILDLTEADFHRIITYRNVLRKLKDSLELL